MGMHFGHRRARRGEVGVGGREIPVCPQRFLHEIIQAWVAIQVPPGVGGGVGVSSAALTPTSGVVAPSGSAGGR